MYVALLSKYRMEQQHQNMQWLSKYKITFTVYTSDKTSILLQSRTADDKTYVLHVACDATNDDSIIDVIQYSDLLLISIYHIRIMMSYISLFMYVDKINFATYASAA